MAVVNEIIRVENDGALSFGNYELPEKTKVIDFEVDGRLYKAKTFCEVTKLKRDGALVYESIPGTAVHNFKITDKEISFLVEGSGSSQVTLELESNTEYKLVISDVIVGNIKSTLSGKVNFSVDCTKEAQTIVLKKI
ncbi:endosialidase [Cellulosilyticum sp. I15G10I2]|uniref:endosialidase n=1 Tax=Cellulosilyticum sp. I15G10I2 TaxID=1892843 RepID=UPI00085CBF93|nr:endosialidase [Cellulosilyticum sp. I15G10I2]